MAKTLEFFYDIGSPWTYLAFHRIEAVAAKAGAELIWKPILVGGVFNQVNRDLYARRAKPNPRIARHMQKDLRDWAQNYGLKIHWPPAVFPLNSVAAMRGAHAALSRGAQNCAHFSRACFEAYWAHNRDLSQNETLAQTADAVAAKTGLSGAALLQEIAQPECKTRLRESTQELIERGGFGSPTMFVNGGDMYFGNDRLPLVEAALQS